MIWALHGAVGMAEDWSAFAERMAAAGHAVRPVDLWDLVSEGGLSLEDFGATLGRQAREEDSEPILLGYSMGGRLALHALLEDPSRWRAAVIVSAHPGLREERDRIVRMAHDAQWAADALTMNWEEFLRKWNAQAVFGGGEGAGLEDRGRLERRRQAVVRGFMEWSLGKQVDLREELARVACPVLWVNGSEDRKYCELGEEAVAALPRGRRVEIPGAGHRIPWDAPEAFAREVKQFLGEILG